MISEVTAQLLTTFTFALWYLDTNCIHISSDNIYNTDIHAVIYQSDQSTTVSKKKKKKEQPIQVILLGLGVSAVHCLYIHDCAVSHHTVELW